MPTWYRCMVKKGALLKFYAFSKMLVLIRSSANLRHAHHIWQLYNNIPLADMHSPNSHIRFIIGIKSLWFTAQCSNMSQRRVKVHCAIWLLWKLMWYFTFWSLHYAQKNSHNNVQVTDLAGRGQWLQSSMHGNLRFVKWNVSNFNLFHQIWDICTCHFTSYLETFIEEL